jgi:hypothetical protein
MARRTTRKKCLDVNPASRNWGQFGSFVWVKTYTCLVQQLWPARHKTKKGQNCCDLGTHVTKTLSQIVLNVKTLSDRKVLTHAKRCVTRRSKLSVQVQTHGPGMAKIETIGFGQNAGFKTAVRLLLDPETILKLCSPDLMHCLNDLCSGAPL